MTIALVQSTSQATAQSAAQQSLAYGAGTTGGNLLVAIIATYNPSITVSVTDSESQTWTQLGTYSVDGNNSISIWYVLSAGGGACTVKVTPSASAYVTLAINEYSGGPFSVGAATTNSGFSATPASGTIASPSSALAVAGYCQGSVSLSSASVASPFTLRQSVLNGTTTLGIGTADDTATTGNVASTFTVNTSVQWASIGGYFTVAAAAVIEPPQPEIAHGPPYGPWAKGFQVEVVSIQSRNPQRLFDPPHAQEIRQGPPFGPFAIGFQVEQILSQRPPKAPQPSTNTSVYQPEIVHGPPFGPWAYAFTVETGNAQAKVSPVVKPSPPPAPEVVHGPPLGPWALGFTVETNPISGPNATPTAPAPTHDLPFVARVPDATTATGKNRLDRFTKIVASLLNSLMGQGIIKQTGADTWTLDTSGGGGSGVVSFNTRTGAVTLQASDVQAALGYTPVPSTFAITPGGGLTGGGPLHTQPFTIGMAPIFTPASFMAANISVDSFGRVVAAASAESFSISGSITAATLALTGGMTLENGNVTLNEGGLQFESDPCLIYALTQDGGNAAFLFDNGTGSGEGHGFVFSTMTVGDPTSSIGWVILDSPGGGNITATGTISLDNGSIVSDGAGNFTATAVVAGGFIGAGTGLTGTASGLTAGTALTVLAIGIIGTTLPTNVVNSSLTGVGLLQSPALQTPAVNSGVQLWDPTGSSFRTWFMGQSTDQPNTTAGIWDNNSATHNYTDAIFRSNYDGNPYIQGKTSIFFLVAGAGVMSFGSGTVTFGLTLGNNPAANVTASAEPGFGTNTAGGNLTLAGGPGTGTGTPGSLFFAVSTPGTSGIAYQSLTIFVTLTSASFSLANHLLLASGTPTIAAGTGAGTSPTVSISGSDQAGVITIVSGTLPASASTVATVTFAATFASAPRAVSLTPANSTAALLSGATMVYSDAANVSPTGFAITAGTSGLTGALTYKFNYVVIG
jgi:hypothetical protein